MAALLLVHHTTSPTTQALLEELKAGVADAGEFAPADLVLRPALAATAVDVLAADGYLLATPANIGYMSGALKHFFDTVYYPVLEAGRGRPYGLLVHGNSDTGGAVRAVEGIATGLGWRAVRPAVRVVGEATSADRDACRDLGGLVALAAGSSE
jgi:NAD(P)H-dependent FMN reductase